MIKHEFYDGILYQIEYQPNLSDNEYKIYHVKTEDNYYSHARKAITSIMKVEENNIWSVGLYWKINRQEPSMANVLHKYYSFSYDEELNVYVFIIVTPYDD